MNWKLAIYRHRVYVAMKAMDAREAAKEFKGSINLEYLLRVTVKDFDAGVTPEVSATNLAALYKEVSRLCTEWLCGFGLGTTHKL